MSNRILRMAQGEGGCAVKGFIVLVAILGAVLVAGWVLIGHGDPVELGLGDLF